MDILSGDVNGQPSQARCEPEPMSAQATPEDISMHTDDISMMHQRGKSGVQNVNPPFARPPLRTA